MLQPLLVAGSGRAGSKASHLLRVRLLGLPVPRRGDVMAVETSHVTWTALFGRAGAMLAEPGGLLCHAATIARERGIPCVVSADGYAGVVRVLS